MMATSLGGIKTVGLPMDLAETSKEINGLKWYPVIQKILAISFIILFAVGFYVLILGLLQGDDDINNSEIIVVSEFNEAENFTIVQEEMGIFFPLNNTINAISSKRGKRETIKVPKNSLHNTKMDNHVKFKDNEKQKLRKIISEHDVLCHEESHKDICKELVMKIKLLTEDKYANYNEHSNYVMNTDNSNEASNGRNEKYFTAITKQEASPNLMRPTKSVTIERDGKPFGTPNQIPHPHMTQFPREGPNLQLSDTCLLARLMRQSYPNLRGVYDSPQSDYEPQLSPYASRHVGSSYIPSYEQNHNFDIHRHKPHPQDIEIAMHLINPSHEITSKEATSNTSVRTMECPIGMTSCSNGNSCVSESDWCNGKVDCDDVSDEARCSCKSRVDVIRICDGYFDCPFGEDEMGCYGCSEDTFSCEDNFNPRSICYSKEQRCNNIVDCPNHKDEIDCSMLAPSLHKKPLFSISNTEGYLHRNYKGNWYAVCKNPYMWAHEACRRETGLIIRPPYIQVLQIDPLLKVDYISTAPGGLIHTGNTCFNSSAVYVTCPDLLCGTRMLTSSQLLKEDSAIESRLYGRNKRFLFQGRPHPTVFYNNQMKRHATNTDSISNLLLNYASKHKTAETRKERAESRVVGGKLSQPAAWPWMVALYRNGMFHCGGVIINQNWVMSAAHCVHKFWQNYYEIQVGMLRRFSFSPQEQNYRVTHVIVNQNYNQEDMKNDLSLLRVKPGIQFSRWARPICLPSPEVAGSDWIWGPPAGTICTAIGWGATVEDGPDPDHMREVEVPIWEHCKHKDDLAGKEICAGLMEGGKDACQGDSGGPLLCKNPLNAQQWYVAGIVSHGDGCARKDEPGVYTRVSIFVPWIQHHISSKSLPVIQPKQECPGFRCDSGITKCLPKRRMCDKIIDCLDGEDEINCDVNTSLENDGNSLPLNALLRETNNENVDQNNIKMKKIDIANNSVSSKENSTENTEPTPTTTTVGLLPQTVIFNYKDHNNKMNVQIESTTVDDEYIEDKIQTTSDNMTFTSTDKSPNSDYSQESTEDYVTFDPLELPMTEEIELYAMEIDGPRHALPPMSSTAEKTSRKTNNKINVDDNELMTTNLSPQSSLPTIVNAENKITTTSNYEFYNSLEKKNKNIFRTDTSKLEDSVNKSNSNKSKIAKESHELSELKSNSNNNNKIDKKKVNTENNNKLDQKISETNDIEHDFHDKKPLDSETDDINVIEDTMILELQPAKIRKKYLTPLEFQCRRIYQIVSHATRCDHKPDCEDGTDELNCTCLDYLAAYDSKIICDGNFDCADGQDEIDCYTCAEGEFLCQRSQICLDTKYVCDGIPQCPLGEDELDCFTLSNGKHILHDLNGRPLVNLDGYITKKRHNNWQIVCEEDMSIRKQEETASHICRYLGFSSANRHLVKYINMKDSLVSSEEVMKKNRRDIDVKTPVHFTFNSDSDDNSLRSNIIKNPELIKEECVPNVTKTCMTLYVYCDHSLYTNFDLTQGFRTKKETEDLSVHMWPWIAKLYIDGKYKCTGVLIDLSWVLISHSCLQRFTLRHHYITVLLGSHKTLESTTGPYEQVYHVDAKKDLYRSKVILLHLREPAFYSPMVKPMVVTSSYTDDTKNTICVAVGQNEHNNTHSVFLKETDECDLHNRCFIRQTNDSTCRTDTDYQWAGIISCHTKHGWYPAASFVENKSECRNRLIATDIGNLKHEIKYYDERPLLDNDDQNLLDDCEGTRCQRGKCIKLHKVCDGVADCEDAADESKKACNKKLLLCIHDPLHVGCECPVGQLKCYNGRCIPKELFKDGKDDCGDGTDEPGQTKCSDYLSRVMPSRLCDGILHCHDRSDEDPMYCKCHAKRQGYKCTRSSGIQDYCVASDMVCDGIRDCPRGDDEKTCIGLNSPQGSPHGIGEVIIRSHGVWYSKCYTKQIHTKSELEAICRELGFISGHAKQLPNLRLPYQYNNVIIDPFTEVQLNNNTKVKLRNSHAPIAKGVANVEETCYPVFIECL